MPPRYSPTNPYESLPLHTVFTEWLVVSGILLRKLIYIMGTRGQTERNVDKSTKPLPKTTNTSNEKSTKATESLPTSTDKTVESIESTKPAGEGTGTTEETEETTEADEEPVAEQPKVPGGGKPQGIPTDILPDVHVVAAEENPATHVDAEESHKGDSLPADVPPANGTAGEKPLPFTGNELEKRDKGVPVKIPFDLMENIREESNFLYNVKHKGRAWYAPRAIVERRTTEISFDILATTDTYGIIPPLPLKEQKQSPEFQKPFFTQTELDNIDAEVKFNKDNQLMNDCRSKVIIQRLIKTKFYKPE